MHLASLALMNPLAFLTSTDQSIQLPVDNADKKHIWIDAEFFPVRKFRLSGTLMNGEGDSDHPNVFLEGLRVNRFLATIGMTWQPVRQYFVELTYFFRSFNYPSESRNLHDNIVWSTIRVDF